MAPASPTPDHEQIRAAVTARYSGLARAARAGQQITDCDPGPFAAGCFGAAGYADTSELPDGAVRASLGCGNPVAVAELHPGRHGPGPRFWRRHRRAAVRPPRLARREKPTA